MLRSEEINSELFIHNEKRFVWKSTGKAFKPGNTVTAVKHGGSSIMLLGSFAASNTGTLHNVDEQRESLWSDLRSTARKLKLGHNYVRM